MPALTATLIAYNEELDLPRALASLAGVADEIILVDSGSTDRTCEIAREIGARVYARKLDGLAEQKNYAASFSSNDWILSIDCDEALSPELRSSLLAWKQQTPDRNGYDFALMTNYLGAWIRHSGWYPDYKLRLYRRDRGKFVSATHEGVQVDGPAGRLSGHLYHYTVRSLAEHRAKLEALSTLAAEDLFARGRKRWRAAMIAAPPWTFVQRLVFQLGLLDGRRGWLIAWLSGNYIYLKYRKLGRLLAGEKLARRSWPNPGEA
ncbi:MAG TPA: glycosyltransferase family 2 protein [Candidatus Acidoferrales bacterium]|nr:glycosyltransferase family 2 protein [Candidatus Acidoferrales bacterium]